MSSSFALTTNLWGWTFTVPSTAEKFKGARAAVDHLLACLAIEEAFATLIANYVSFEKAVAGANIEHMVERNVSRSMLDSRRREIDRHLVNLLAAGEMFTEHVRRRIKKGYGRSSREFELVEAAFGSQRERLAGFWATEHLRDAVLHNSLPVTSWTMNSQWVDLEGSDGVRDKRNPKARNEYSVTFSFDLDLLALDRRADRELISRLRDRANENGKVSWVPIVREYVEALSLVLKEIRLILEASERAASEFLSELCDEFRSALPRKIKQPRYVLITELTQQECVSSIVLNIGLEDQILELRQQHKPMINLHRRNLKN